MIGGLIPFPSSCSSSGNTSSYLLDLLHIMDAIRLFLGNELVEVSTERGGGELLVTVLTFLVLDSLLVLGIAWVLSIIGLV